MYAIVVVVGMCVVKVGKTFAKNIKGTYGREVRLFSMHRSKFELMCMAGGPLSLCCWYLGS